MANTPVFFISDDPTLARVSRTLAHALCLRLNSAANVLAMALFVMALAAFVAAAFIGVFVLGSISERTDLVAADTNVWYKT